MNFFAKYKSGELRALTTEIRTLSSSAHEYELTFSDYTDVEYIAFPLHENKIKAGDKGYYLVPAGHTTLANRDYAIGYFSRRDDIETLFCRMYMPVFGYVHAGLCRTAIVTGMPYDVAEMIAVKGGEYTMELRFILNGKAPYENIKLELHDIADENAGYSDMARIYREHQLANGFASIKKRINPTLAYAAESPAIRVRMGWKPVPCQIAEQTVETEPPMHVACTFDDVSRLMDEYKKIGIEKAEFCLVGWNIKGHDGRWPQALPVEAELGGKEALLRLTTHAKELGYAVCCHTNSTDAYSIADCFNEDEIIIKENGELSVDVVRWAGGRSYMICPKRAYETLDRMLVPMTDLGFNGTHYIDVITCVASRECFSDKHPVNKKEGAYYWNKLLGRAKELFGSVGSEGAYDHSLCNCDTTLYVSFLDYKNPKNTTKTCQKELSDKEVPFWQLVYHGIVLSNPYARTVNAILDDTGIDLLKVIEYGGRPQFYYYAHFVDDGTDWIGRNDFFCHTDDERRRSAEKMKAAMDIFGPLSYLQYEFMEKHEEISDGVYAVTYSDGSVITVDYNSKSFTLKKGEQK